MMKHRVTSLTTGRVLAGTWLAVLLHQRNVAEGKLGMTETCATLSAAKMHATGLKTDIRSMTALNRCDVNRGTMTTMVPLMTILTDSILTRESRLFSHDLKRVRWPLNFKPSGIKKYDGSPTQPSCSRCISSPSRPPVGTQMSCQTTCQSACHHPPGPGS
jgi:hypothetical protein